MSRMSGHRPPATPTASSTHLEILTWSYVTGKIDVEEFEKRLEIQLRHGLADRPAIEPPPPPKIRSKRALA